MQTFVGPFVQRKLYVKLRPMPTDMTHYGFVAAVLVPHFLTAPRMLIWGGRFFFLTPHPIDKADANSIIYVEDFAYAIPPNMVQKQVNE